MIEGLEQRKSESVQAMMTPDERARLTVLAARNNTSVSKVARACILKGLDLFERYAENDGMAASTAQQEAS